MRHFYTTTIFKFCNELNINDFETFEFEIIETFSDISEFMCKKLFNIDLNDYSWLNNMDIVNYITKLEKDWKNNLLDTDLLYNSNEMKEFILNKYFYEILKQNNILSDFENDLHYLINNEFVNSNECWIEYEIHDGINNYSGMILN